MSSSLDCGFEDKATNVEHLGETESRLAAHKIFTLFWRSKI